MKKIIKSSSKKDKVLVVLEKMQDSIGLIAEGQTMFRGEMNRRFDEVDKRFDEHDQRFVEIGQRFSGIENNLKIALEYLFKIDEEITQIKSEIKEIKKKDGIDKNWIASIEKRIGIIEKQLKIQKQMAR
jgi:septation ring formation regulator EzrA